MIWCIYWGTYYWPWTFILSWQCCLTFMTLWAVGTRVFNWDTKPLQKDSVGGNWRKPVGKLLLCFHLQGVFLLCRGMAWEGGLQLPVLEFLGSVKALQLLVLIAPKGRWASWLWNKTVGTCKCFLHVPKQENKSSGIFSIIWPIYFLVSDSHRGLWETWN